LPLGGQERKMFIASGLMKGCGDARRRTDAV
jgi:hypothetical protein